MSVVVPTHDRCYKVLDCVRSLVALDHPGNRYEIVVVDAASRDETPSRMQSLAATADVPLITYIRSASSDANAARNVGASAARGELIAFIDDDVIVPAGWAGSLVKGAIENPQADCLGGPIQPIYESSPPRTCSGHELAGARFDEGAASKAVSELWGGNMAIRREAFRITGPFREGLPVLQEWEWQQRLLGSGRSMVYLPDAWLWHRRGHADLAVFPVLRDMFRRGYIRGLLGEPFPLTDPLQRGTRMLAHAALTGCARGLGECARETGLAAGELARRRGARFGSRS